MVKIKIGDISTELENADESWITQQIQRRRADGQIVRVRVIVHKGDLNMVLATPACPSGSSGNRPPRPHEKEVFNLWDKHGLNDDNFNISSLVAFIGQLKRLL